MASTSPCLVHILRNMAILLHKVSTSGSMSLPCELTTKARSWFLCSLPWQTACLIAIAIFRMDCPGGWLASIQNVSPSPLVQYRGVKYRAPFTSCLPYLGQRACDCCGEVIVWKAKMCNSGIICLLSVIISLLQSPIFLLLAVVWVCWCRIPGIFLVILQTKNSNNTHHLLLNHVGQLQKKLFK